VSRRRRALGLRHGHSNGGRDSSAPHRCSALKESRALTVGVVAKRKPASTMSGEQSDRQCSAGRRARS
jgi:hypothetical protein